MNLAPNYKIVKDGETVNNINWNKFNTPID